MIILLQFIAIGIFILVGLQIYNTSKGPKKLDTYDRARMPSPSSISPAGSAAAALRELENVRADLRVRYPLFFGMLGGYLNEHTIQELGTIEAAVEEMISDWSGRRDEISLELVRVLAENPDEEEIRAIIMACCETEFDEEGYRNWLTWLLGRIQRPT